MHKTPETISVKGYTLTIANGEIVTQARILGGCVHTTNEPCVWRAERSDEQKEDLARIMYLGINAPSKGAVLDTFFLF